MGELLGERAVVLGGGMAGLLAARVLADRYRSVLIVDRDQIVGVTQPRRGVPQARHAHALLAKGQQIMEELFPGLVDELNANGGLTGDLSGDLRWYVNGHPLKQADSGLLSVSATRPMLEAHVRARVAALSNVDFLEGSVIQGLVASPDRSRITGASVVADGETAAPEQLPADLVVDATGRGSRTPAWLEELGYERPAEEKVRIDLAYVSRFFRLTTDPFGDDLAINPVASPDNPRGAFFGKFPDDIALLSLTGILGDHPPRDDDGFLRYARTLSAPEIYEAVRVAEPLGETAAFKVPASVRRRYDTLRRFPAGFLVVGDGVCSFNPVYGQGMTVAAMEADALAKHLDAGAARALEYFREIKPIIDVPWETSVGADLAFPGVEGPRTLKVKMGNAYISRLHTAAQRDGRFTRAFFRVAGLVDPPQALMRPGLMIGALRTARKVRADQTPPPRFVGNRAVVLGGSIAGTLAARVLSESYREVVVVDRDEVLGVDQPRRGAPHTGHAHGLHARGYLILAELFPNLLEELRAMGVPVGDLGEMRWYFNARLIQPARTGLLSITAPRPVLENYLRNRVAALPNVTYRQRTELLGLLATEDRGRVTGVRLRECAEDAGEYRLDADLVVDATGRGSRLPVWLSELGYERPVEDRMKIGLAYTTRMYRKRPEMFDGVQSINPVASPDHPRGAFFGQVSADECIVSLTGILGDHPPTDPDGFLKYARSLPVPDVYDGVRDAEPTSEPVSFGFPASVRRRYERLHRFPDRLLVLGDAVCSFNPVYGQGMTVAAMEAMALREHLRRYATPDPLAFLREIGRIVDPPWEISTSGDLDFPGVEGPRPAKVKLGNAFMARLQLAATRDPAITNAFMRVAGLIDPPTALMRPRMVAKVLWHSRRSAHRVVAPAVRRAEQPTKEPVDTGPSRKGREVVRLTELADYVVPFTLRAVCDLRIADHLVDGPRSVEDLARLTGTHAPSLYRALRALACRGVFAETDPGVFTLTPLAEPLRTDHPDSLRDAYPLIPADVQAWSGLAHSLRTGQAAFDHVLGTGYWQYMSERPEESARFDASQEAATRRELRAMRAAWDWGACRTVVDVGGGNGAFLAGILATNPAVRGIVFDQPHVVAGAPAVLAAHGVADRCDVVGGSFLESVPAGGDTYVLKRILYAWDDEQAATLLQAVRAAMPADGRLLLMEPVLEPGNAFDWGKLYDVLLLVMSGCGARSREQLEELFAKADLELVRVVPTRMLPIVEARPV